MANTTSLRRSSLSEKCRCSQAANPFRMRAAPDASAAVVQSNRDRLSTAPTASADSPRGPAFILTVIPARERTYAPAVLRSSSASCRVRYSVISMPSKVMGRLVAGPSATTPKRAFGLTLVCAATSTLIPADARKSTLDRSMIIPAGDFAAAMLIASVNRGAVTMSHRAGSREHDHLVEPVFLDLELILARGGIRVIGW